MLVLLPTSTSKLLAQWQGPYPVLRRVGRVNYEVDMADHRKRKRIFHVNMLRKWQILTETSFLVGEEDHDEGPGDVVSWNDDEGEDQPTISDRLGRRQIQELHVVMNDFTDVFSNQPDRTNVAGHRIKTGAARPVRRPPYRGTTRISRDRAERLAGHGGEWHHREVVE